MSNPLDIPTDEQEKKRLDEIKAEKDKEDQDLIDVLNTACGRRFLFRIIDHAETMREPFVAGSFDLTSYNLGKQSEGKFWLTEILRLSPDKYFQMCREKKSAMVVKETIRKNKEE